MDDKFLKPYNPKETESRIYKLWEESGYFNPDKLPKSHKKPFTIIMPPPNANGIPHLGHALTMTLEDIMIRYKRMSGYKTLWLPGTDHAGFETQVVYEKKLEKEGRSRFKIPPEELWKEIWDFVQENKGTTESTLRRFGSSCDWSREKFTLDPDIISEVQDTFIQMHKDKLVYRGNRLVNWCVKHQTGLSDLEVKHEPRTDSLYYIKYGPLVVATVRPETIFGDTAVAVNPKDKRYKNLVGKEIEVDVFVGKLKLKVIADSTVDQEFGTGAVKITPAHDSADFEMWQRHKEEIEGPKEVINHFGKMDISKYFEENEETKKIQGTKASEARKIVVEELQKRGLIEKIDSAYNHEVSLCYKCSSLLEPRLMAQWFIKMDSLAKKGIEVVKNGKIKFTPPRYNKIYYHWLKNIRDWNISRQIIWGIKIPAWFCKDCGEAIVSKQKPSKCLKCKKTNIEQDTDVFDTWFSSGQWPFLTLGYPKGKDFKNFYPTDVMETGSDLIFFWVSRMIMLGLYRAKQIPFKNVYMHGMVRDKNNQKMSKSKGNVIDPLVMMDTYGTDAMRMALVVGNTPGSECSVSDEKIKGYKNFANKIWNIGRFVMSNTKGTSINKKPKLSKKDAKYLSDLNKLVAGVTKDMDNFRFYIAAEKIYHYTWHTLADKIIEEKKNDLSDSSKWFLLEAYATCLQLLHPFMPFITEEIWMTIFKNKKTNLIIERWPTK